MIEVKWGYKTGGPNPIGTVSLQEKEEAPGACAQRKRPCEDIEKRWPSANQGERPQEKQNLLGPWSWTSSLQDCEKINFCCLGHPVCTICYGSTSGWTPPPPPPPSSSSHCFSKDPILSPIFSLIYWCQNFFCCGTLISYWLFLRNQVQKTLFVSYIAWLCGPWKSTFPPS